MWDGKKKNEQIRADHCRVCNSRNISELGIIRNFYLMNLDQSVQIPYGICNECKFVFQSSYVGDDFLNHYYANSPMLRRKEMTEFEEDQNVRQSAFLASQVSLYDKDVLEIGAHAGAFLIHLQNNFKCKAYYEELSEEARRVLASQDGLRDFRQASKDKKMDVVILRHVLEHIYDIDGFIAHVRKLLKPEGALFVEVPDWSWLDEFTDPLMFEHINQFNTNNITQLMARNGWICEAIEKSICAHDPATSSRVQRLVFRPFRHSSSAQNKPDDEFRSFYSEHLEAVNRQIDARVSSIGNKKRIALYPASHLTFAALHETSISNANLVGMFDIDPTKAGKKIAGIEVFPAAELARVQPDVIFLFTMSYEHEIRQSFKAMGLNAEVISIAQL